MKLARTSLGVAALLVAAGCASAGGDNARTRTTSPPVPCLTCDPTSTTAPTNVGVATNSGNTEHPPPEDVTLGECTNDDLFGPTATGTLINQSSQLSNYMISVNFTDNAGTIVAAGIAFANNIPAGVTATWEAQSFDPDIVSTGCTVVKVERMSAT